MKTMCVHDLDCCMLHIHMVTIGPNIVHVDPFELLAKKLTKGIDGERESGKESGIERERESGKFKFT